MNAGELLLLENQFIGYYNSGMTFDLIKQKLSNVPEELLQKWVQELEAAKTEANLNRPRELSVLPVRKDVDGKYMYEHKLQFQMPAHEMVRFSLWQASSIARGEGFEAASPERQQILTIMAQEAAMHLKVVEKYLAGFNFKRTFDEEGKFTYQTTFETKNDPTSDHIESLRAAINFYIEKIEVPEYLSKNPKLRFQGLMLPSADSGNIESRMPIAIKQFYVQNFRGIKELRFDNIPVHSKWIFVTGENGYGKTSLLQAILLALHGSRDNDQVLFQLNERTQNTFIGIEYMEGNSNVIRSIWDEDMPPMSKLISYGPSRLIVQTDYAQHAISAKTSSTYALFNPDGVLLNIERDLIIWHLSKMSQFDSAVKIIKKLVPQLNDITVTENNKVLYQECEENGEAIYEEYVSFDQLASGIRSIIAMVGDMIIRLSRLQPELEDFSKLQGVVIIDEFDLHWHPKWQRAMPTLLSEIFPQILFIVSTHSVIPILGAPPESIFIKVDRSVATGVTATIVPIEIKNLLPNNILSSPLFNFSQITSVTNEILGEVRTENLYSEILEDDRNKAIYNQYLIDGNKFTDDLFLN